MRPVGKFVFGVWLTFTFLRLSEIIAGFTLLLQAACQFQLAKYLLSQQWSALAVGAAVATSVAGIVVIQRRVASGMLFLPAAATGINLRRNLLISLGPGVITNAKGLTAVITGGNIGIGLETTRRLLLLGFDVYICCRSERRAMDAISLLKWVMEITHRTVTFVPLDLADDASIRACASRLKQLPAIDVLINNAGLFDVEVNKRTQPANRETLLQVNFIGLVLLTELLLPYMITHSTTSKYKPRIVNVASIASLWATIPASSSPFSILRDSVDPAHAMTINTYGLSKLLVIQYTRLLAERTASSNVAVCSLHPGAVLTDIFHSLGIVARIMPYICPLIFKYPDEGCLTTVDCVASTKIKSGAFYADCRDFTGAAHPACFDNYEAQRIWKWCQGFLHLDDGAAVNSKRD